MQPVDAEVPASVNRRRLLLAGFAVVVALAFVAGGETFRAAEPAAQRPSKAAISDGEVVAQAPAVSPSSRRQVSSTPLAPVVPSTFVPSDYAVATVVVSADNLMAISHEDKAWLAKHGYPTLAEIEWSKQASLDELKAASRSDARFAALYGERLWEKDYYREGKALLIDALARGSLYAAEAIAMRALRDSQQSGNVDAVFEAAAWWFYAAQMGNYRASSAVTNNLNGLSVDSLGPALTRSFAIAQEIDAARAAMGLSPAIRDPRPSFDLYREQAHQREVTVISR